MDNDTYCRVTGPDGPVLVASNSRGISAVVTDDERGAEHLEAILGRPVTPAATVPAGLEAALRTGDGSRLRYDLGHLTAFSQAILRATLEIPVGETRSYGQLAAEVGRPGAARGVGSVMRRNPVPFLIPCHRVVRSDGSIGEYSAGGPRRKRALLAREASLMGQAAPNQRRLTTDRARPTTKRVALTTA